MNIVCIIQIMFIISGINFIQKDQVEGKILFENETKYLVDFSQVTKKKGYIGDYSKILVDRSECLRLQ